MKVIVYVKVGVLIDDLMLLYDVELLVLIFGLCDLFVWIDVIVVNLVDLKLWFGMQLSGLCVFGWDVVGMVEVVGVDVELFVLGDKVWYVGDIMWFGSYVEYGFVDEWIVSCCLMILGVVDVVVLLLIVIIVWELLFDWLKIVECGGVGQSVLVIGVGGGVGFIFV